MDRLAAIALLDHAQRPQHSWPPSRDSKPEAHVLVSFVGRSFSTNSRPALRAAACGGRPRSPNPGRRARPHRNASRLHDLTGQRTHLRSRSARRASMILIILVGMVELWLAGNWQTVGWTLLAVACLLWLPYALERQAADRESGRWSWARRPKDGFMLGSR
jgi:hypothetical protein